MSSRTLYTICFTSLAIFLLTLSFAVSGWFIPIDNLVSGKIVLIRTGFLDAVMRFFSFIGSFLVITGLSAVLMVFLYRNKKIQDLFIFAAGIIGGFFLTQIVKSIISRPRPPGDFITAYGYSFPSGHAITASVLAVLLIYFFSKVFTEGRKRNIFISTIMSAALLIDFSRLYFDVHWLSDVIAGAALGIFWGTLVIIVAMTLNLEKTLPG